MTLNPRARLALPSPDWAALALLAALATALPTRAADTGDLPCRTTEECRAQAARIGASTPALNSDDNTTSALDKAEDQFHWMNKINKASAVMLVEEKIIPRELGQRIARGVQHAIDQAKTPQGKRPTDVLQIERLFSDQVGPEATMLHVGRSRQDMLATYRAAKLRNQMLDFGDALLVLRSRTLELASRHVQTFIPAYTNGVQAQPISLAHYLLAFDASYQRDAQRIREAYARLNRSAMGTAVLANSSWPLNRPRLAELLGFDGLLENALDAGQIAPYDQSLEVAGIAASTAVRIGAWMSDIHTQYHQTRPWLLLDEGATYTSSAMPQKRNPGLIMRVRERASNVVGLAQTVTLRAHNVTTGMTDYKEAVAEVNLMPQAVRMLQSAHVVLEALRIDPQRSLEELEDDWTPSMELAEALQQEHNVPFRVGHRFASDIVTAARSGGFKAKTFPYARAVELYAKSLAHFKLPPAAFPFSEARFRQLLSPAEMVRSRVGVGGPQPAEVERMLRAATATLVADQAWSRKTREAIQAADTRLDEAFGRLAAGR